MEISFVERVKNTIITCAIEYERSLLNKYFLIYSKHFCKSLYYTIHVKKDNFLHLTGVITSLSATEFFDKAVSGKLEVSDFSIGDAKSKGSIRRKISVLNQAILSFANGSSLLVEESFGKNSIICAFATSNNSYTLGFRLIKNAKPVTLLKGNLLKNPLEVDLILEYQPSDLETYEIVYNRHELSRNKIKEILDI